MNTSLYNLIQFIIIQYLHLTLSFAIIKVKKAVEKTVEDGDDNVINTISKQLN